MIKVSAWRIVNAMGLSLLFVEENNFTAMGLLKKITLIKKYPFPLTAKNTQGKTGKCNRNNKRNEITMRKVLIASSDL